MVSHAPAAANASDLYFAVSWIRIKPGKLEQAIEAFSWVVEQTHRNEPDALIYRFYKVKGDQEFVFIEKFTSKEAYARHTSSDHVKEFFEKYMSDEAGIFDGTVHFKSLDTDHPCIGGFERSDL